jgi:hypothetical protein
MKHKPDDDCEKAVHHSRPYPTRNDWKRILGLELIELERQERERRDMRHPFTGCLRSS